jgi:hypothetical protein
MTQHVRSNETKSGALAGVPERRFDHRWSEQAPVDPTEDPLGPEVPVRAERGGESVRQRNRSLASTLR